MLWEAARNAILQSSAESSVYIGCDSVKFKKQGIWYARYATVVVVHKDSRHGCQIFYDSVVERDYGGKGAEGLMNRLMNEVNYAMTAAAAIADVIGDRHLELHFDVNPDPKHKSNIAASAALGWAAGQGYDAKIKPEGWAATHAADHAARFKTFAHG